MVKVHSREARRPLAPKAHVLTALPLLPGTASAALDRSVYQSICLSIYLSTFVIPGVELGALHSPRSYIPSPAFILKQPSLSCLGCPGTWDPIASGQQAQATTPSPSCNYCLMGTPCAFSGVHRVGPPATTQRTLWGLHSSGVSYYPSEVSEVLLLGQGEEHCLGCVLEEGGSILLLPFLHPVTVDSESIGVNELTERLQSIRISNDDRPGYGLQPTVLVVDPYRGQHG